MTKPVIEDEQFNERFEAYLRKKENLSDLTSKAEHLRSEATIFKRVPLKTDDLEQQEEAKETLSLKNSF